MENSRGQPGGGKRTTRPGANMRPNRGRTSDGNDGRVRAAQTCAQARDDEGGRGAGPTCGRRPARREAEKAGPRLEAALGKSRAPRCGRCGRGQDLDKARPLVEPRGKGRHAGDRRRHGQHLPRSRPVSTWASRFANMTSPGQRARSWPRRQATGCEILLPSDVVVAHEFAEGAEHTTVAATAVPGDWHDPRRGRRHGRAHRRPPSKTRRR